jgi:hypothetical protein
MDTAKKKLQQPTAAKCRNALFHDQARKPS